MPANKITWLGPFSRLDPVTDPANSSGYILIVLSGPEPQRTLFEEILLKQLSSSNDQFVLVRGLPAHPLKPIAGVEIYEHVDAKKLSQLASGAKFIICRSGYTSLMDMLKLNKKMIVVPTPGQTEQEYLASYLMSKKILLAVTQNKFILNDAIEQAAKFDYQPPAVSFNEYKNVLKERFTSLRSW